MLFGHQAARLAAFLPPELMTLPVFITLRLLPLGIRVDRHRSTVSRKNAGADAA
jgi:hypothetical protein